MLVCCCCLCGSALSEESTAFSDISMFGSDYFSILQQILEEREKELICVVETGSICMNCVGMLQSVEICLNKLRDLKLNLINNYKHFTSEQSSVVEHEQVEQHQQFVEQHAEHVLPNQGNENEDENLDPIVDLVEVYADDIHDGDDGSDVVHHVQVDDDTTHNDDQNTGEDHDSSASSRSPSRQEVQVFDVLLDGPGEMEALQLDLDLASWSMIFKEASSEEEKPLCLADGWKSKLLSLFKQYIQDCDIDVMSVKKTGQFPVFMAFCKVQNCTKTLQMRLIQDFKIEVQYSSRQCAIKDKENLLISTDNQPPPSKVCEYCLKNFRSVDSETEAEMMKNHLRVCHSQPRDQIYTCRCGRRFNKAAGRNAHLKRCERNTDTEQNIVSCEECGHAFNGMSRLQRHMKTCKPPTISCNVCSKVVNSNKELEKHMVTAHNTGTAVHEVTERRKYPCDKCDKVFWKKYNLQSHLLMHSDLKPFVCEVEGCTKRFKRDVTLRQHVSTRHQNKTVILYCALCTAQFKSASGLKLHMESIHELGPGKVKKFPCTVCEKRFKCPADLMAHSVTHTKIKNFACNICHLKFARSNSLKDHMNVHNQIYKCDACHKCFGRDRYLQSHIKICPLGPNGTGREVLSNAIPTYPPSNQVSESEVVESVVQNENILISDNIISSSVRDVKSSEQRIKSPDLLLADHQSSNTIIIEATEARNLC